MDRIIIDPQHAVPVTPGMIGLFFEDINYNLDGGLYAQLLENRSFESLRCYGTWDDYKTEADPLFAWTRLSDAELTVGTEDPVAEENPHYLKVKVQTPGAGFSNRAYDGITLKKDASYRVSFYARSAEPVLVRFRVVEGGIPAAETRILVHGAEWKQYVGMMSAQMDIVGGNFTVELLQAGTIDFDWFSLMPEDAVLGIFRKDLFEKLKDLKPGFMRFPGGCIIEGNNLANRYQWKKTIGPQEHRVYNWNRWAVHGVPNKNFEPEWEYTFESQYSHYGQTYGVGYYEYFLLCEAIGAKPLPVLSVGLACQYQSTELVPIDAPEFQEFIQDALDLIEFANGDVTTEWGAKRAAMGHPEPFGMDRIGIGNEQWQTEFQDFYERYEAFEKAIHAVYPEMKLIGSAGPDVITPRHVNAWNWIRRRAFERIAETGAQDFTYAVDEHYYVPPRWLYDNVHFYDEYPREVKVFAGEYAAHIDGLARRFNSEEANRFEGALAEAAFLTGVERNADVVVMASYAPLIARAGWAQWSPDLIWCNGSTSYGTPSYYVQKLYSLYMAEQSLGVTVEGEGLFASLTTGTHTFLKVVNNTAEPKTVKVDGLEMNGAVERIEMAYALTDRNSFAEPEKVIPVHTLETVSEDTITVRPHSFTIFCK